MSELQDKHGETIEEGDTVRINIRGGGRRGEVTDLVHNDEEAEAKGVKGPEKVVFDDPVKERTFDHKPGSVEVVKDDA